MTGITASFRKPFAEQVAAFRLRLGDLTPTAEWDDIQRTQHDRAFMVAGAMKADLLADLGAAVDKAILQGTTLETFRRDFREIVERHGWHGWKGEGTKGGEAWRTKVIYKTNMRTTYAAGRMAQLVAGNFKLWVYRHGGSLDPRIEHLGWDGLILPPDHPFWATHAPPNGWGCSCYIVGARTLAGAVRVGGKPGLVLPETWAAPVPKTGAPAGIDKGWDYAPGASVAELLALGAKKLQSLPAGIGSDFGAGMAGTIDRYWPIWLVEAETGKRSQPGLVGVLSQDVLLGLRQRNITAETAELLINPGLVAGPKARRHANAGDALTSSEWLLLPQLLRAPLAVLLDERTGRLIYLMQTGVDGRGPQLAVALDYRTRINRETSTANIIVSAYRPLQADILGRLAGGLLSLVTGKVG
ncbi:hypothetical protein EGN72_02495 [Pseudorhodobacter sp. E13]|uniref:phage head morphogenesis protein n=1 Tax=Pseudorhodobacter sp. E13 TaxID=2487931 RepID=UPI000F8D1A0C|nr:phage minor head protein [Pseudorhodobacter sp. E13]RUS64880.1 hypothetical protein EGN72_02495 [Pseudorhodobacter sp. E13]